MTKKIKLHTSIDERAKQHRNAYRKIGWGQGVTEGVSFSWSMLRPNFWGAWFAISLLFILVNILPFKALLCLGRMVGRLMLRFLKSRRYVVERNLELAFPEKNEKERADLTLRIFENAGMGLFETGMAWFWPDFRIRRVTLIDEKTLEKARELAATKPRLIVLSAHFVTLELSARLYALAIAPGIGIYRSSDHPVWEYIQVKGRLRSNIALVDRKDVRSMVKALMKCMPIWYAPDQDYGLNSAVFVPFFGVKEAATVTGLHDLARIKDAKVQPYWLIREDNGYRMHVLDVLENFPSEDAVADTICSNKIIEEMINCDIAQYLWMHRRFKTVQEGRESNYPDIG